MAGTVGLCGGRALSAMFLAFVVASGACGGDGEPVTEDALPESSEATPGTDEAETLSPREQEADPGVDEVPVSQAGAEEDPAAPADEEFAADDAPEPPPPVRIPAGTRINAAPAEDISTTAYRVDDPVIVTVTRDVLGPSGELLLRRGVRLLGRVRTSMGSGGTGEPAVLEIDFETLSADRYERPIEGAVVNRPVILDPAAARRRRSASGRAAAMTEVPGLIMAGTIIVVELRAPVEVPPSTSPGEPPPRGDSPDARGDPVGGPDTTRAGGVGARR